MSAWRPPLASSWTAVSRTEVFSGFFSGIWQALTTANWNILAHAADNFANRAIADPESKCYLPGLDAFVNTCDSFDLRALTFSTMLKNEKIFDSVSLFFEMKSE